MLKDGSANIKLDGKKVENHVIQYYTPEEIANPDLSDAIKNTERTKDGARKKKFQEFKDSVKSRKEAIDNNPKLKEECGVFGISNSSEASTLTALGLHALQLRAYCCLYE